MPFLLKVTDRIDRLCEKVGQLGSWLILPLIFIIIFDVLTRKFQFIQQAILNSPLYEFLSPTKLQEMEWHLHAAIFLTAFGMTYLHNAHVRVDVLRENLSHRRQAINELLGILFFALPFFAVICFYSWEFVARAYLSGEGSDALTGLPHRWIIKSVFLVGVVVIFLTCVSVAIKLAFYLFGKPEHAAAADEALNIFPVEVEEHVDDVSPGDGSHEEFHVDNPEIPDENRPMT
ncbi:TRAP transporter small permease subunit [Terasakiella sp. SH-1]|uniref:TRAP transporter small permease subunit n=1 Tax=Terasakiella sp. SH-1 TaxID=2560057 RepID=UPI0010745579|nr:TRAP transporter small permease subunit [Terasakiella sp. SH-1]